jgi:hypothetical protein
MSYMKRMIEDRDEVTRWALEENISRIACRIKGATEVVEGWQIGDGKVITVLTDEGVIVRNPIDGIEAIWFLGHWMDIEEYTQLA